MSILKKFKAPVKAIMQKTNLYVPAARLYGMLRQPRRQKEFSASFDELIADIRTSAARLANGRPKMVVTGMLTWASVPTLFRFLEEINAAMPEMDFIYLDEEPTKTISNGGVAHHHLPHALRPAGYDTLMNITLTEEMKSDLASDKNLAAAAENLHQRQSTTMNRSYAQAMAWYYNKVYRTIIECYKPKAVMIWSKFPPLHLLCDHICRETGVTPLYIEFGSLPGTFALDSFGQMGESDPARNYKDFLQKPVTDEEIARGEKVLNYLRESRLNRNVQTQQTDELDALTRSLDSSKPIVLLAGHNDFDSGLLPYDDAARTYHSPMFESSAAAVEHFAALSRDMGFQLVFKPHPAMVEKALLRAWPKEVHLVTRTDINKIIDMADVVVSIVSQTSYVSSIRRKATLTVGYNQLRGKGVTYEAYRKEDIPSALSAAIRDGFTDEMQRSFNQHAAQMLRYALYDDLTERPLRFGQSVQSAADFLRRNL